MNLHFMIIVLSFVAPVHKDLPLVDAPQIVAPSSPAEDRATLKEWEAILAKVKEPV